MDSSLVYVMLVVIGGFWSVLSITCINDRNVSAGVLISEVVYQCKWW